MDFSANPFTGNAFSTIALTQGINLLPNRYGKILQKKIFRFNPLRVRQIAIEEQNGQIILLPTMPPGSPGTTAKRGKRKLRTFTIPHIPHDDTIQPNEVQGIRGFGTNNLVALSEVMAKHLQDMRDKHEITHEYMSMGALKGVILDADGSVIYDLFDEFEITPKVIDFALDVPTTDIKAKCLELKRHIEDNLRGEISSGVRCFVHEDFFDALTGHPKVVKAWELFNAGAQQRTDQRAGFEFAGITFEEYRGQVMDPDGNLRRFIETGNGHAFPEGTASTFSMHAAPADFNETVNTMAQLFYAKQEPRKFERGTDLHTQSNPLPMCARPGVLVTVQA